MTTGTLHASNTTTAATATKPRAVPTFLPRGLLAFAASPEGASASTDDLTGIFGLATLFDGAPDGDAAHWARWLAFRRAIHAGTSFMQALFDAGIAHVDDEAGAARFAAFGVTARVGEPA